MKTICCTSEKFMRCFEARWLVERLGRWREWHSQGCRAWFWTEWLGYREMFWVFCLWSCCYCYIALLLLFWCSSHVSLRIHEPALFLNSACSQRHSLKLKFVTFHLISCNLWNRPSLHLNRKTWIFNFYWAWILLPLHSSYRVHKSLPETDRETTSAPRAPSVAPESESRSSFAIL